MLELILGSGAVCFLARWIYLTIASYRIRAKILKATFEELFYVLDRAGLTAEDRAICENFLRNERTEEIKKLQKSTFRLSRVKGEIRDFQ